MASPHLVATIENKDNRSTTDSSPGSSSLPLHYDPSSSTGGLPKGDGVVSPLLSTSAKPRPHELTGEGNNKNNCNKNDASSDRTFASTATTTRSSCFSAARSLHPTSHETRLSTSSQLIPSQPPQEQRHSSSPHHNSVFPGHCPPPPYTHSTPLPNATCSSPSEGSFHSSLSRSYRGKDRQGIEKAGGEGPSSSSFSFPSPPLPSAAGASDPQLPLPRKMSSSSPPTPHHHNHHDVKNRTIPSHKEEEEENRGRNILLTRIRGAGEKGRGGGGGGLSPPPPPLFPPFAQFTPPDSRVVVGGDGNRHDRNPLSPPPHFTEGEGEEKREDRGIRSRRHRNRSLSSSGSGSRGPIYRLGAPNPGNTSRHSWWWKQWGVRGGGGGRGSMSFALFPSSSVAGGGAGGLSRRSHRREAPQVHPVLQTGKRSSLHPHSSRAFDGSKEVNKERGIQEEEEREEKGGRRSQKSPPLHTRKNRSPEVLSLLTTPPACLVPAHPMGILAGARVSPPSSSCSFEGGESSEEESATATEERKKRREREYPLREMEERFSYRRAGRGFYPAQGRGGESGNYYYYPAYREKFEKNPPEGPLAERGAIVMSRAGGRGRRGNAKDYDPEEMMWKGWTKKGGEGKAGRGGGGGTGGEVEAPLRSAFSSPPTLRAAHRPGRSIPPPPPLFFSSSSSTGDRARGGDGSLHPCLTLPKRGARDREKCMRRGRTREEKEEEKRKGKRKTQSGPVLPSSLPPPTFASLSSTHGSGRGRGGGGRRGEREQGRKKKMRGDSSSSSSSSLTAPSSLPPPFSLRLSSSSSSHFSTTDFSFHETSSSFRCHEAPNESFSSSSPFFIIGKKAKQEAEVGEKHQNKKKKKEKDEEKKAVRRSKHESSARLFSVQTTAAPAPGSSGTSIHQNMRHKKKVISVSSLSGPTSSVFAAPSFSSSFGLRDKVEKGEDGMSTIVTSAATSGTPPPPFHPEYAAPAVDSYRLRLLFDLSPPKLNETFIYGTKPTRKVSPSSSSPPTAASLISLQPTSTGPSEVAKEPGKLKRKKVLMKISEKEESKNKKNKKQSHKEDEKTSGELNRKRGNRQENNNYSIQNQNKKSIAVKEKEAKEENKGMQKNSPVAFLSHLSGSTRTSPSLLLLSSSSLSSSPSSPFKLSTDHHYKKNNQNEKLNKEEEKENGRDYEGRRWTGKSFDFMESERFAFIEEV